MLGSPILYLKGMRIMMFQLSGFYFRGFGVAKFGGEPPKIHDGGRKARGTGSPGLL